jgi:predicted dehydrogenase
LTINILQIGAGIRGRHWIEFVKAHPEFECVALVEPDAATREQAENVLGPGCRSFESFDDALKQVEVDAALVVRPSATHAAVAGQCVEAGLHVMVEKPLATTIAAASRLVEQARRYERHVIVAENYRYWPAEQTIKRLLDERFLGQIDNAVMVDRRHQPSGTEGPWLSKIEYPQLQEIATHHFDSLRAFFGARPTRLSLRCWNPPWTDYAHGANTEALIEFGEMHVQYIATMLSHRYAFSLYIEGERGSIWTNRELVFWRPNDSRLYRYVRNDKVPSGDEKPYPQGGTTSLLNSFRDAVVKGQPAATAADENIWTIAMVEAGKLSDRERRSVDIGEVYAPEGAATAA